jgi:hypothetical protein
MPRKTKGSLDATRTAVVEINDRLAALDRKRKAALLAGDDRVIDALDAEIDLAKKQAARHEERITLLKEQAQREEAEAAVKRKLDLIRRIEGKLAERDAAGAELQEVLGQADKLFRRVIALSEEVVPAWSFSTVDLGAALLTGQALAGALSTELFRVGGRPRLLGGREERFEPDFPGGRCPDHRLLGLPEQLPHLTDTLCQASAYVSDLIRNRRTTAGPVPAAATPAPPAVNGHAEPQPAAVVPPADTHLMSPAATETPTKAALLRRQNELAADPSPEAEVLYQQTVRAIAELS